MSESPAADNNDLESFGYRQELKRSMGSFSSFAAGFSAAVGVFTNSKIDYRIFISKLRK